MTSSSIPEESSRSIQTFDAPLKSSMSRLKVRQWTNLSECMAFIAENGSSGSSLQMWMRQFLDDISSSATPGQFEHLLNGYAQLHGLVLHLIEINENMPINKSDIRQFSGYTNDSQQQRQFLNKAYIMYNSENSLFSTFYATGVDDCSKTSFTVDDERIDQDIAVLLNQWNLEVSQRVTEQMDHVSEHNDETKNTAESRKNDSSDELLLSESIMWETAHNTNQYDSQNIDGTNFYSNGTEINFIWTGEMETRMDDSSDGHAAKEIQRENPDHMTESVDRVKRFCQETEDGSSIETNADPFLTEKTRKEQELESQRGMLNVTKKIRHTRNQISSSNNIHSSNPIHLAQNSTEPATLTIRNEPPVNTPVQLSDPVTVIRHPNPKRRVRYLTNLAKKECPLVQAGEMKQQRIYPEIEVPDNEGHYVCVRAVTEKRDTHPITTVAPEGASVDWTLMKDDNQRPCLQCDLDSFDPKLGCVYLPITSRDRQKKRKKIRVHLFNWKQSGPTSKQFIECENLRLCRLEVHLCSRLGLGRYQSLSQPSYTSIITLEDGDVTIDEDQVKFIPLCERGGEKISIPLSCVCLRKSFTIEFNEEKQLPKSATMERKKLLILSPAKKEGTDRLRLVIKRTEFAEDTSMSTLKTLFDRYFSYVKHGECIPTCPHRTLVVDDQTS